MSDRVLAAAQVLRRRNIDAVSGFRSDEVEPVAREMLEAADHADGRIASALAVIEPALGSLAEAPELRTDAQALLQEFAEWMASDQQDLIEAKDVPNIVAAFCAERGQLTYVGVALLREIRKRLTEQEEPTCPGS